MPATTFPKHKLFIVSLALDNYSVKFFFNIVDIFEGLTNLGNQKKSPVIVDFRYCAHNFIPYLSLGHIEYRNRRCAIYHNSKLRRIDVIPNHAEQGLPLVKAVKAFHIKRGYFRQIRVGPFSKQYCIPSYH
jgi:hypothetical protein